MRPRNRLAYRLALPLAIVLGPAPAGGAGPIVAQTVVPAGRAPARLRPSPTVKKEARVSDRPETGRPPAIAAPWSLRVPRRRGSAVLRPWRSVRPSGDGRGNEVKEVETPDQVPATKQGLPTGGPLLLPLPPNPEPAETQTYVGEPSGTTGEAVRDVTSPSRCRTRNLSPSHGRRDHEASSGQSIASRHNLREPPVERMPVDKRPSPPPRRTPQTEWQAPPPWFCTPPLAPNAKASPAPPARSSTARTPRKPPFGSSAVGSSVRDSGGRPLPRERRAAELTVGWRA